MFGCYRKGDAADPETYAAAVAAVLADYPLETVLRVTNPVHGLPSKANWLPTVKEVREACDAIESRKQWLADNAQRERDQIAARRREDASRKQRPTLDELKANHGENWGLRVAKEETAAAQRRDATLRKANKVLFERECIDNGMPANSPISPSLAALIKAGMA